MKTLTFFYFPHSNLRVLHLIKHVIVGVHMRSSSSKEKNRAPLTNDLDLSRGEGRRSFARAEIWRDRSKPTQIFCLGAKHFYY